MERVRPDEGAWPCDGGARALRAETRYRIFEVIACAATGQGLVMPVLTETYQRAIDEILRQHEFTAERRA